MEEVRVLTGGMDLDSAPEYLSEGDYREAVNVRNRSIAGKSSGRMSFWNDFDLDDSVTLPDGINRTLKTVTSESQDFLFAINYNSGGKHTLVKYSGNGTSNVLFTNLDDTGGVDLLNWDEETYLNDAVLHQHRWLILTDGQSEIKMFDTKALEEGYNRGLVEQDITLAKAPPLNSPLVEYVDSTSILSNNLLNRLFKFKYKYTYSGGFESAWSPASVEVLPNNLNEVNNGVTSNKQNLLRISVRLDSLGIEKVSIAATSNGGEWVSLRDMPVSEIMLLPDARLQDKDEIFVNDVWVASFYNPFAFNLITADDADHNYDAIPRAANTLDLVNNNTLLVGGLKDEPGEAPNLNVTLSPVTFSAGDYTTVIGRGDLSVKKVDIIEVRFDPYYHENTYIELQGTPLPGDVIKVVMNYGYKGVMNAAVGGPVGSEESAEVFSYTVSETDTTLALVYGNLARVLPNGGVYTDSNGTYVGFHYNDAGGVEGFANWKTLEQVDIDLGDIGYVDVPTKRTFKKGSTVQFALSYKDKYGRYLPLETSSKFIVDFPFKPGYVAKLGYKLNWTINHQAPAEAASFQWFVSPDMKHQSYVDLLGDFKKSLSKVGKYIVFDLSSLNRYVNRGIPGVNYSFTKGDRVYIETYWLAGSVVDDDFAMTGLELSVIGMDVLPMTSIDSRYLLKVEYNKELWDLLLDLPTQVPPEELAVKLQIYTPRVTDPNLETTIFREIGPAYPVNNGIHSVTSGQLEGIDDFIRGRVFEAFKVTRALGFAVEDRNITDDVASLVPFKGNVRTVKDIMRGLNLTGSIRFSDVSVENGLYNGINRFFEGRIYGEGPGETTAKHGAITKMKVVGNYLKVLQEDEVGVVPVYLSMVQDNSGSIQTADSDKILNTVRYLGQGRQGTGSDAKSFAIDQVGNIFFFDKDRKVPLMLQGLTLRKITSKCSSHFLSNVLEIVGAHALYDPHQEYWLTYTDRNKGVISMSFDEATNRWTSFVTNAPEASANLNGEFYSFKNALRYKLSNSKTGNKFYGISHNSQVDVQFPASFVRTFKSLAVHADNPPSTVEDGITTSLDYTSDLVDKDFKYKEGIWYANFLRDKASGLFSGHVLKGKWVSVKLEFIPKVPLLNFFKLVVKSKGSTANE